MSVSCAALSGPGAVVEVDGHHGSLHMMCEMWELAVTVVLTQESTQSRELDTA